MRSCALLLIAMLPAGAADRLDDVLARVATYEHGQSRAAVAELDGLVREALASPERLKSIESRMDAFLRSGATLAAKDVVCRHLSLIGTEASVPVLVGLLDSEQTAEPGRYALERIPGAAVNEALRKALAKSSGKTRTGIVNTLGVRRDAAAVSALGSLLESEPAAAHALASIGNPAACGLLEKASRKKAAREVSEALLVCAERGNGAAIYKRLYEPGNPEMIRVAALRGLAASSPGAVEEALKSDSARIRAVAIQLAKPETLVREFPALPPAAQVQAISALASRKFDGARTLVTGALKNERPDVRTAAIRALGDLGDASTVSVLADTAAASEGADQTAARDSLYRLRGPGIDKAVAAALPGASGRVKAELVRAAGERGVREAVPALFDATRDQDSEVRRESLRALRETAGPEHLDQTIALLLGSRTGSDRREAERTVAAVVRNSPQPPVAAIEKAYRGTQRADARASLLMVMAAAGMRDTLPLFREALKTGDADAKRAAVLALAEWPSAEAAPDLIEAARDKSNLALQVLALRGYVKLVTIPSQRSAAETARLLGDAMQAAPTAEEKKAVLAALQKAPSAEALRIAEQAVADPEVAAEARLAAAAIRRIVERKQ